MVSSISALSEPGDLDERGLAEPAVPGIAPSFSLVAGHSRHFP